MKIVFVGPLTSRFVRNDVEILSRQHELITIDAVVGRGGSAIKNLITLQLKIISQLLRADCLFFWFADYYSFFPTLVARLLGKKSFVVAGGFDVWYMPELKIGARNRAGRWWLVRNTFRFANHIFPVSEYANRMLEDSVKHHGPNTVIYNTVNTQYFLPPADGVKEKMTLTVTQVDTVPEYTRKGIDLFIKAAKELPAISFVIAGIRGEAEHQARKDSSGISNVVILPAPLKSEELLSLYQRASSYAQLSIDETFGVAVAEGMSCGCIPVVSNAPALMEVVGNVGAIIDRNNIASITKPIEQAVTASDAERETVRGRARMFDFEERAKRLLSYIH